MEKMVATGDRSQVRLNSQGQFLCQFSKTPELTFLGSFFKTRLDSRVTKGVQKPGQPC